MDRFDFLLAGAFFGCIVIGAASSFLACIAVLGGEFGLTFAFAFTGTGAGVGGAIGFVLVFVVAAAPERHRCRALMIGLAACSAMHFVFCWFLATGIGHV